MKKRRDDKQVKGEIVLHIYNKNKTYEEAIISSIIKDVGIHHSRLKKKLQELIDSGAIEQKDNFYFLTPNCQYMIELRRTLAEFPGLNMSEINSLSRKEEIRFKKTRTYYKSLLLKDYLSENGEINWVRLTYDHLLNYIKNNGIKDTKDFEFSAIPKLRSSVISAAENLIGRKIDSQNKVFYKNRISTISYNLISFAPQILI